MRNWTRWVLAHRRLVAGSWLVVTIPAFVGLGPAVDALTTEFTGFETSKQTTRKAAVQERRTCRAG
jgi:hypothetical protein